jgi:hypothetical protein
MSGGYIFPGTISGASTYIGVTGIKTARLISDFSPARLAPRTEKGSTSGSIGTTRLVARMEKSITTRPHGTMRLTPTLEKSITTRPHGTMRLIPTLEIAP